MQPLFVLMIVTVVAGPYHLYADKPPDFATRMGQYLTRADCERHAAWWNRHIAETKVFDESPDTGIAVCVPQPEDKP